MEILCFCSPSRGVCGLPGAQQRAVGREFDSYGERVLLAGGEGRAQAQGDRGELVRHCPPALPAAPALALGLASQSSHLQVPTSC